MSDDITLETTNQAAFESLLEAITWRIIRREKDRVIIERVETGEQAEVKAKDNEKNEHNASGHVRRSAYSNRNPNQC